MVSSDSESVNRVTFEDSRTAMFLRTLSRLLLLSCLDLLAHESPGAQARKPPSAAKSLAWGPGLEANVVLPARFFYVQAVDSSGRK